MYVYSASLFVRIVRITRYGFHVFHFQATRRGSSSIAAAAAVNVFVGRRSISVLPGSRVCMGPMDHQLETISFATKEKNGGGPNLPIRMGERNYLTFVNV